MFKNEAMSKDGFTTYGSTYFGLVVISPETTEKFAQIGYPIHKLMGKNFFLSFLNIPF